MRPNQGCQKNQALTKKCAFTRCLPRPERFDVVFVIGLHKTGTSLLTEYLADCFLDTSRITNPQERGYGCKAMPRYLTRECAIVRRINQIYRAKALLNSGGEESGSICNPQEEMENYFRLWSEPVVIKAPFFAYSLSDWLETSQKLGRRVCVCTTIRPLPQVIEAWDSAPFTQVLLAQGELPRLIKAIEYEVAGARANSVEVREFTYDELMSFRERCQELRPEANHE
jgi:hypothetical protein